MAAPRPGGRPQECGSTALTLTFSCSRLPALGTAGRGRQTGPGDPAAGPGPPRGCLGQEPCQGARPLPNHQLLAHREVLLGPRHGPNLSRARMLRPEVSRPVEAGPSVSPTRLAAGRGSGSEMGGVGWGARGPTMGGSSSQAPASPGSLSHPRQQAEVTSASCGSYSPGWPWAASLSLHRGQGPHQSRGRTTLVLPA